MKRTITALLLAVSFLLPVAARAGVYITPKFLVSDYNLGTVSRSSTLRGFGLGSEDYWTVGGGLAAGYDFYYEYQIPVRLELEFALRSNASENWKGSNGKVESEWNTSTSFLNFYWDFHNDTAFVPYIGAGLGMAHQYAGYDVKHDGKADSMDDRFTSFAWNAGLGVAYNMTDNFAIDLGYRFIGISSHELSENTSGGKYKIKTDPYINEFTVGARFSF